MATKPGRPKVHKKGSMVSIRVRDEVYDHLRMMAAIKGKSVTAICTESCEEHLFPKAKKYAELCKKAKNL